MVEFFMLLNIKGRGGFVRVGSVVVWIGVFGFFWSFFYGFSWLL